MDEDTVIAVEWSENIEDALLPGTIYITLRSDGGDKRTMTIDGDERFEGIGD